MTAAASHIETRDYRMKQWQFMLLLTFVALFLAVAVQAQDKSQIKDALKMEEPPLKIELKVLTPTSCLGAPLKLRVDVTNVGQETLKVNGAYLWNNYSELPAPPEGEESKERFMTHIWPRSTSEDIFFLTPGETHVVHRYWPLDEQVTKAGAGKYIIEIAGYGNQNRVQVELHDCQQKELRSTNERER